MSKMIMLPMLLIMLLTNIASAQEQSLASKAYEAYQSKDYNKCSEYGIAAINQGQPTETLYYNTACCLAMANRKDESFQYLTIAVEKGYKNVEHLQSDTDLQSLHDDKRWHELIDKCQAALDKYLSSLNKELRAELLAMEKVDQEIRNQYIANQNDETLQKKMEEIDKADTARMKEIIKKYGWPGNSLVGQDGAGAAWLLVQHADNDHEFQNQCLALMKVAVEKGEASKQEFALLTDRVQVGQGKKQIYGTQFQTKDGEMVPFPIEDEQNVDARRKEVGLSTLEEYRKLIIQVYQSNKDKK